MTFKEFCQQIPNNIGKFVNNNWVQTIMTLFTIYALIGDDLRLLCTTEEADKVWYLIHFITLCVFIIELLLSSIGIKGYFGSFFFWLDLISSVSLITDIEPIWTFILNIGTDAHDDENLIQYMYTYGNHSET